jgi:hypothetical protein
VNRSYSDFGLYTLPNRKSRSSARLLQLVGIKEFSEEMETDDSSSAVNKHFLELERKMHDLGRDLTKDLQEYLFFIYFLFYLIWQRFTTILIWFWFWFKFDLIKIYKDLD